MKVEEREERGRREGGEGEERGRRGGGEGEERGRRGGGEGEERGRRGGGERERVVTILVTICTSQVGGVPEADIRRANLASIIKTVKGRRRSREEGGRGGVDRG